MYLGFDLGTTNVKAVVVADDGRIVGAGSTPVERFTTPDDGVEQDIEQIWAAVCGAIRQATDGLDAASLRRALGRGKEHRLRLDSDVPCLRPAGSSTLLGHEADHQLICRAHTYRTARAAPDA